MTRGQDTSVARGIKEEWMSKGQEARATEQPSVCSCFWNVENGGAPARPF
jgi:hypothetical protein